MNWWKTTFTSVSVMLASFTFFVYLDVGNAAKVEPNARILHPVRCYDDQKVVTSHMQRHGFKIIFNWMDAEGTLIKLVAANKKANVILIHIEPQTGRACVIDELGENTHASKVFMELFDLVSGHGGHYGAQGFTATY